MECGDCTVCCTLSVVSELNKKAGEHCTHCDKGCKIYGNHPQVCKDFECAYLQGGKNINLRPDKCGIMFFKKNERIFCGILVPDTPIDDLAFKQIVSFKNQGYSVILLKLGEKQPHIELAKGHNEKEIYQEYINLLRNGNL
jgi:hypothetical protein